ncbi:MAG: antibiotic biosynthesis monooxygenase [Bifidobacteriaceae bacterium]|jgi:quinol monooxygenase YgiN|nr:antibiotic biosynthesis monooxygenase [Bifidobacteriaceae bacterium]
MADPVVVVATFFPREGMRDSVHAVIKAAQTDVYQEPGCLLYSLHEAPDRFVLIEKWASLADLEVHGEGKALAKLAKALDPLLAEDIQIIHLQPVKDESEHLASAIKGADA